MKFTDPGIYYLCRGQGIHSWTQQHVNNPAAGNMATDQLWVAVHMGHNPCVLGCTICSTKNGKSTSFLEAFAYMSVINEQKDLNAALLSALLSVHWWTTLIKQEMW